MAAVSSQLCGKGALMAFGAIACSFKSIGLKLKRSSARGHACDVTHIEKLSLSANRAQRAKRRTNHRQENRTTKTCRKQKSQLATNHHGVAGHHRFLADGFRHQSAISHANDFCRNSVVARAHRLLQRRVASIQCEPSRATWERAVGI